MTLRLELGEAALDVVHEAVVADAVLHDQLGFATTSATLALASKVWGSVLGLFRIEVTLTYFPADLAEDVRVLVLRADGDDHAGLRAGRRGYSTKGRQARAPKRSRARRPSSSCDLRDATARRGMSKRSEVVILQA